MKATYSFEMLDASYPMTQHHVLAVDLNRVQTRNKTIKLVAEQLEVEGFFNYKAQLPLQLQSKLSGDICNFVIKGEDKQYNNIASKCKKNQYIK